MFNIDFIKEPKHQPMLLFNSYTEQPLIIYGAGNLGRGVLNLLNELGMAAYCVCDKNPALHNNYLDGVIIKNPDGLDRNIKEKGIVLVSIIAVRFKVIRDFLIDQGFKNIYFAGDFLRGFLNKPLLGIWDFTGIQDDGIKLLENNLNLLADIESKNAYLQNIEWFAKHTEASEKHGISPPAEKYFINEILRSAKDDDIWVDTAYLGGEYVGKINDFTEGKYSKILSFKLSGELNIVDDSPNPKVEICDFELGNMDSLVDNQGIATMLPFATTKNYKIKIKPFDLAFPGQKIDYFRCYSLNRALDILNGASKALTANRPIIMCNISHYIEDFSYVPDFLNTLLTDYKFLFKGHGYYANDSILYAIPKEKEKCLYAL